MRHVLLIFGVLIMVGCSQPSSESPIVAKVGDYTITKDEFDEAFRNSSYASAPTVDSRQLFLNNMINQKLILLDAEAKGMDKDKEFLKMIEHFWQQSLLTTAMQAKVQEGGNLDQWVEHLKQNTKIEINGEYLK